MTVASKPATALVLALLAFAGCGGGGHTKTVTQTTAAPVPAGGLTPATAPLSGRIWPDAEAPPCRTCASIGRMPGTTGPNGAIRPTAPVYNGTLARPAAAAWNTMNLYSRRYHHVNVTAGGGDATLRTVARQVYWSYYWCGAPYGCAQAAPPGTSNHGWGRAVDLLTCGSDRSELDRIGRSFGGWRHGEAPNECWHVTMYAGGWKTPDPGADYNNPRLCHGSSGPGQAGFVKDVQHSLSRHRIPGVTNGYFTLGTVARLKRFQAQHHLHVHTCTDKATWKELRR